MGLLSRLGGLDDKRRTVLGMHREIGALLRATLEDLAQAASEPRT